MEELLVSHLEMVKDRHMVFLSVYILLPLYSAQIYKVCHYYVKQQHVHANLKSYLTIKAAPCRDTNIAPYYNVFDANV